MPVVLVFYIDTANMMASNNTNIWSCNSVGHKSKHREPRLFLVLSCEAQSWPPRWFKLLAEFRSLVETCWRASLILSGPCHVILSIFKTTMENFLHIKFVFQNLNLISSERVHLTYSHLCSGPLRIIFLS